MDDAPGRRYADDETALILKRAAELQGSAPDPSTPTLAELEQVAGEAGIDPRYVRQAAAELASSRGVASPSAAPLQRTVPGEIPSSALDALVEEIRAATGMAGQTSVLGRGFTWISTVPGQQAPRAITITVAAVDGRTVIRADESLAQVASAYTGLGVASALMGGFGSVAAASGNPSVGVIAGAVAWAGGSLLGAQYLRRRASARHRRDLAALLERIAQRAQALAADEQES